MTATIERRRLADRDDEFISAGLDYHRNDGGVFLPKSRWSAPVGSRIQICLRDDQHWPPPYLFVGPESTTANVLGTEFAKQATMQPGIPDREFEYAVNRTYREVHDTGLPTLDTVRAIIHIPQPIGLIYNRLILPSELRSGQPIYSVFTSVVKTFRVVAGTTILGPDGNSIPSSHRD